MCTGHTVVQATPQPQYTQQPQKPVVYMQNRWLDGLGINAESSGRNSLRIDPGSPTPMKPERTGGPDLAFPVGIGTGLGIGGGGNRPPINDGSYRRGRRILGDGY